MELGHRLGRVVVTQRYDARELEALLVPPGDQAPSGAEEAVVADVVGVADASGAAEVAATA